MFKLKQFVIVAVASIAIFASVNYFLNEERKYVPEIVEPVQFSSEIAVTDNEVIDTVNLSSLYNEIISSDSYQIERTKSMTLDDNYIELIVSSTEFDNMTGDCHATIINDTYEADMWYNVDTYKGYLAMSSTVSDSRVNWVPITSEQSKIVDTLFYSVTNDALLGTVEALLEEVDSFDTVYIKSSDEWKVTGCCDSGNTTIFRHGDNIKITVDNPVGTDKSTYIIRLHDVHTDVPEVCTRLTSSICDLNAIYKEIKEF